MSEWAAEDWAADHAKMLVAAKVRDRKEDFARIGDYFPLRTITERTRTIEQCFEFVVSAVDQRIAFLSREHHRCIHLTEFAFKGTLCYPSANSHQNFWEEDP